MLTPADLGGLTSLRCLKQCPSVAPSDNFKTAHYQKISNFQYGLATGRAPSVPSTLMSCSVLRSFTAAASVLAKSFDIAISAVLTVGLERYGLGQGACAIGNWAQFGHRKIHCP